MVGNRRYSGGHYFPRMRALFDKIDVEYFDEVVS